MGSLRRSALACVIFLTIAIYSCIPPSSVLGARLGLHDFEALRVVMMDLALCPGFGIGYGLSGIVASSTKSVVTGATGGVMAIAVAAQLNPVKLSTRTKREIERERESHAEGG